VTISCSDYVINNISNQATFNFSYRNTIMNTNKITKALAGSLLVAASTSAVAKVETFQINFVTIQDLSITQIQAVGYGQNIIGKAGTSCDLTVAVTATGALAAAAQITDALSGTGCLTVAAGANGLGGVYNIAGAASQTVNVTVASSSTADFDFSPNGKIMTAGAATTATTNVFADSAASVALDGTNGRANLYVGGTITVGAADLTANTPYSASFDITAVY
jgi:hypothetical protein